MHFFPHQHLQWRGKSPGDRVRRRYRSHHGATANFRGLRGGGSLRNHALLKRAHSKRGSMLKRLRHPASPFDRGDQHPRPRSGRARNRGSGR